MATLQDTAIIIRLDPEALAILERLAEALEALVRQQGIATPPHTGPFLGDDGELYRIHVDEPQETS